MDKTIMVIAVGDLNNVLGYGLLGGLIAVALAGALARWAAPKPREPQSVRLVGGYEHGGVYYPADPPDLHPGSDSKTTREPPGISLPAGATWTLAESWASNLTAIVTAVGLVAGVLSDKLAEIVRVGPVVAFALSSALFLAIAALAPIVYTICQTSHAEDGVHGTWTGWCLSAAVTLFAVDGALSSAIAATVIAADGLTVGILAGLLGLMAVLVAIYVWRSYALIVKASRPESLVGTFQITCCSGAPNGVRVRVALL